MQAGGGVGAGALKNLKKKNKRKKREKQKKNGTLYPSATVRDMMCGKGHLEKVTS